MPYLALLSILIGVVLLLAEYEVATDSMVEMVAFGVLVLTSKYVGAVMVVAGLPAIYQYVIR